MYSALRCVFELDTKHQGVLVGAMRHLLLALRRCAALFAAMKGLFAEKAKDDAHSRALYSEAESESLFDFALDAEEDLVSGETVELFGDDFVARGVTSKTAYSADSEMARKIGSLRNGGR